MGDVVLLRGKEQHAFKPLMPAGTCCSEMRASIRAPDEEGRKLTIRDHVIYIVAYDGPGLILEDLVVYCYHCGTRLIDASEDPEEEAEN